MSKEKIVKHSQKNVDRKVKATLKRKVSKELAKFHAQQMRAVHA